MRYIIVNKETGEPIKQLGEIIYFKNQASAQRYQTNAIKEPLQYKLTPAPDFESKEKLINYENAIMDIYHAIEIEKSDENLLKLAKLLHDVLKDRRKTKFKLRGYKGNSIVCDSYKNRTSILDKLELNGEENEYLTSSL